MMTINAKHKELGTLHNFTTTEWLVFQATEEYQLIGLSYSDKLPLLATKQQKAAPVVCEPCAGKRLKS